MMAWVAVAYGALDVRHLEAFPDLDILVAPVLPGEPFALFGEGALLWRRLVSEGPIADDALDDDERNTVREMAEMGIVSSAIDSFARMRSVSPPWFVSPQHELVCGLVASVATELAIPCVFVKGPVLHAQGLRSREHSGDVDVWVHPWQVDELVARLERWGWRVQPDLWTGTPVNHSITLSPGDWGCEIDVHRRLPGLTREDDDAFELVLSHTESMDFAGVTAKVPDRIVNSVLLGVHVLRPEIGKRATAVAVTIAADALRAGGESSVRRAGELGAVAVLKDALAQVYPDRMFEIAAGDIPHDWQWRSRSNKVAAYLIALRGVPLMQRPRVLWRIVWPSREAIVQSERLVGEPKVSSPLRARLRRLRRGLRNTVRHR